jgi:hypothetical protein
MLDNPMLRTAAIRLLITMALTTGPEVWAQSTAAVPASTYEVQINGESFEIEANRVVKLESKEKPGVSYQVAVRVAPTQRIRLSNAEFEYELPAKVEDDGKRGSRSIRLTHELGFSLLLSDLGPSLEPEAQKETLKMLVESVTSALGEEKAAAIDVSEPHERTFAGSAARGITIRYRDAKDFGHVCLLYVLTDPNFAVSCVVEYLDNDGEDVLPLVKKTLDSVRASPERR